MNVIGLMSGTSLDAVDGVLVQLHHVEQTLHLSVKAFSMSPYRDDLRDQVRALLPPQHGSTADVCKVNALLGEIFAEAALQVAEQAGMPISDIDLVASHGQTVYHQVAPGEVRSTLQIGAPAVIAERTGCTVVADFRTRDIAAGGQGAPLVPYLDRLLFADARLYRAVQNIGGMANVTYLPPAGKVVAFDTGPGNVLIDEAVRFFSDGAASFDRQGAMAAAGSVATGLLAGWLEHPYFRQAPPKSTGREQWGLPEARQYIDEAERADLTAEDTIATLTALTAESIADAYRRHLGRVDEMIVGGGGARNLALLGMLERAMPGTRVRTIDEFGLNADAKEAVAFAVMGYATVHGWPNNVPEATGATRPVVLGSVTPGSSYRKLLEQLLAASQAPAKRGLLA